MAVPSSIKAKVCLVGEIAVGKTSLVRRFSQGTFDELYTTTLGISVSKKVVEPRETPSGGPKQVEMILFDIMGQRKLRELLVDSYFKGAQALLAVWDVTRPETLRELPDWISMAQEVAGPIPVVIATNKVDLAPNRDVDAAALDDLARVQGSECFTTSAKTGENVEAAFERLAMELVRRSGASSRPRRKSGVVPGPDAPARGPAKNSSRKPR